MKKEDLIATIMSALGGLLFALPWFFLYINKIITISFLTILIPIGFFLFYKLFKENMNLYYLKIVGLGSLLIVLLSNVLLIPLYSMRISNVDMRFDNLLFFFSFPKFRETVGLNIIIGTIFVVIGTMIVYFIQKKQLFLKK